MVKVIFVGKLKSRKEVLMPFANCAEKDPSKCAVDDHSEVSVEVSKIEKGTLPKFTVMILNNAYCAPSPPSAVGEAFRFFAYPADLKPDSAVNKPSYVFFEPVPDHK